MERRIWITWWIILYIRYSRLLWIYFKKHGENTVNPSVRIYINNTENRKTFKIKAGSYLELLTSEIMKFLGSTKSKKTKDENGKNVPYSEINEVVLIHC